MIKETRDDIDETRFFAWLNKIEKVVSRKPEWIAKWYHELCLFYLNTLNYDKVREIISRWPINKELPFYEAKRAAILGEIGDVEQAESIVEESLKKIRLSLPLKETNYQLLSQEGLIMIFSKALKTNKFEIVNKSLSGQYRDRWERLSSYGCNPFVEIDYLKSILNSEKPSTETQKTVVKKDFDHQSMTVTENFTSGYSFVPFLPAFAFLRIYEDGALPVKCGMTNIFSEAYLKAATWIEDFAPLWSTSAIIRTDRIKDLENIYDRVRIATLPNEVVDYLYNILTKLLKEHLSAYDSKKRMRTSDRLNVTMDMLSRLTIRLDPKRLSDLSEIVIDIYRNPHYLSRPNIKFYRLLMKRLFAHVSNEWITEMLSDLINLPIPSVGGYVISEPDEWPEPFEFIALSEKHEINNQKLTPDAKSSIDYLISLCTKEKPEARKRALLRLSKIYKTKGLNENQTSCFTNALWNRTDQDTGLPQDTYFYAAAFLFLPSPEKNATKEALRNVLLKNDFQRMKETTIDGRFSISIKSVQSIDLLKNLHMATKTIFNEESNYITWSGEEAKIFVEKAFSWWNDEKDLIKGDDYPDIMGIANRSRRSFIGLQKLIADVIIPYIDLEDKGTIEKIDGIISEMHQYGITVLESQTIALRYNIEKIASISFLLEKSLLSSISSEVRGAIDGISKWIMHSKNDSLLKPPDILFDKLVQKIAYRKQPELNVVIYRVTDLIRRYPDLLRQEHIAQLIIGLEFLLNDTLLPERKETELFSEKHSSIPFHERPYCRSLSAMLSKRLESYLINNAQNIPDVIATWKNAAQTDVLPEVRAAWLDV